ncbi:hypothetical protein MMC34_000109 [Xylographa carneopallida]|nr:hypothetical protein [Xylographa carneopallida]
MKTRGPEGKIFTLVPKARWRADISSSVLLPDGVRGHMVIPLGWAEQWNWVSIVTVTSSLPESGLTPQYVPIWQGQAPKNSGLHLKLCNCWGLLPKKLRKVSYVRLDWVYAVPLEILQQVAPDPNGSSLELQRASFKKMMKRIGRL